MALKNLPVPSRLLVETGEHTGMIYPLCNKMTSIGRGPENSIQIIDTRMSRNHTVLINGAGRWVIRDLESKNGVDVNGSRIEGDTLLKPGDRIQVGDTYFLFEQDASISDTQSKAGTSGLRVMNDEGLAVASESVKLDMSVSAEGLISEVRPESLTDEERLEVLCRSAELISSALDLDELLDNVISLIQKLLKPDRIGILLYDKKYQMMIPRQIRRPPDSTEDIIISQSIIQQAVEEKVAVIVNDAPSDFRFQASDSIVVQRIHSAICSPLIAKGQILGVIYMDRKKPAGNYQQNDLRLIAGISNQTSLAILNAHMHQRTLKSRAEDRELEIARTIQEHLLPSTMPESPYFDIHGFSHPAHMVGGDYYDVITLPDDRIVLAVADVSGKGVPAALLIASVRAAVQVEVRNLKDNSLIPIMDRLNHMVCRDTKDNMFVTLVLAVLEPHTRQLTYVNAGHVQPVAWSPESSHKNLKSGGCFFGVIPGTPYQQETIELPEGSSLSFFTDGITDAMNEENEMFGMDRLNKLITRSGELKSEDFCSLLLDEIEEFRGEWDVFDDLTMLMLRSI
jgi:sigma-B regulation protein RsbU (phosphoserine phosphatase)